jgi:hypothetical protein
MIGGAVTPALASKLAKVLSMLGSDHDGEIAAAGRRAHALVKGAGLTWGDVIGPATLPKPGVSSPHRCWRVPATPGDCAALCLRWSEVLTGWEAEFCRSLAGRRRISPKQLAVLRRIATKVEAVARAAGEC